MALRRRVVCEALGLEEISPAAPPDFVGFFSLTRLSSGTGRRAIPTPVPLYSLSRDLDQWLVSANKRGIDTLPTSTPTQVTNFRCQKPFKLPPQ